MGHTNSTTYYGLPQFLTSDKPAWLTDINNAFSDIDTGLHSAQSDATTAGNNATQAISDASAAATAAATADAKGAGACASIEATFDATAIYSVGSKVMYNSLLYRCTVAVVTPGPWTGSDNWERITVDSIIPGSAAALPYEPGSVTTTKQAIDNKVNITDLTTTEGAVTAGAGISPTAECYCLKTGNVVQLNVRFSTTGSISAGDVIFNMPAEYKTPRTHRYQFPVWGSNAHGIFTIDGNGLSAGAAIASGTTFMFNLTYIR